MLTNGITLATSACYAYAYAYGRLSLAKARLSPGSVTAFDSAEPRLDPAKIRERSRSSNELKLIREHSCYLTCR